jgi:hypothetical protein
MIYRKNFTKCFKNIKFPLFKVDHPCLQKAGAFGGVDVVGCKQQLQKVWMII